MGSSGSSSCAGRPQLKPWATSDLKLSSVLGSNLVVARQACKVLAGESQHVWLFVCGASKTVRQIDRDEFSAVSASRCMECFRQGPGGCMDRCCALRVRDETCMRSFASALFVLEVVQDLISRREQYSSVFTRPRSSAMLQDIQAHLHQSAQAKARSDESLMPTSPPQSGQSGFVL